MYGFVVRISLRQHVPLRTGVENPQHRFKDTTRGNRLSTRTPIRNVFFRKMIPDAFPLPVREPNHSTFIADRTAAGNFEIGSSHRSSYCNFRDHRGRPRTTS